MANLITKDQLISGYLSGVKLTDPTGKSIPDFTFQNAINNAVSWFEATTKIHTTSYNITNEPHDYRALEYLNFGWIQLYEFPIQSVTNLQAIYPTGQTIMLFPSSWLKIYPKAGSIQLVPTAGTLSQVLLGQGGSYLPLLTSHLTYLPQLFFVTYTAGFAEGQIPALINDVIAMRSATYILDAAGSMAIEQGIQSKSISIDGISQSISAGVGQWGAYSGIYNSYKARIEELMPIIQQEYKGQMFTVL